MFCRGAACCSLRSPVARARRYPLAYHSTRAFAGCRRLTTTTTTLVTRFSFDLFVGLDYHQPVFHQLHTLKSFWLFCFLFFNILFLPLIYALPRCRPIAQWNATETFFARAYPQLTPIPLCHDHRFFVTFFDYGSPCC